MFNNERINRSHHHLQNSRKFKSWFRSFIHKNDLERFDQHDSFKKEILLRSFKQNQIRKHFKSKVLKYIERSKHTIFRRLHHECIQSHHSSHKNLHFQDNDFSQSYIEIRRQMQRRSNQNQLNKKNSATVFDRKREWRNHRKSSESMKKCQKQQKENNKKSSAKKSSKSSKKSSKKCSKNMKIS